MEAFERAVGLGVDWIELDVQTCGTKELVVIHEPDLQRLGGTRSKVCELPLADLQSIDVGSHFSAEFAGARVPTLLEVLETFSGRVRFHVEVKEYGIRGDGTAKAAAALVDRMELHDEVLLSSYNVFSLGRIRAAYRRARLGLVYPPLGGVPGPRRSLRDAVFGKPRAARWLKPRALLPEHHLVTSSGVTGAHARGIEVHAWLVDDPERMRELAALRVDGILTNRPDLAVEVLREGAAAGPA